MTRDFCSLSRLTYFDAWWKKLSLLLMLSLCFKLWVLLRVEVINSDAVDYLQAAQAYLSGDITTALKHYRMPFYPMLIAATAKFLPDLVLAGQLLSVFFLAGVLVPFCLMVRAAWDEKAAFWGGALLASSPYLNQHAADVLRDPAYLFFLAWGIWATWRLLKTGLWRWAVLAGLMATLSTLCRIEGALLFLAFSGACLTGGFGMSIKRRIAMVIILIVSGPLCLSPIAAWIALRLGELPASRFPELLLVKKNLSLVVEKYRLYHDMLKNLESQLPHGERQHGFFELARHYIPVIYTVGLAESFVRVASPAIFLASVVTLRHSRGVAVQFRQIIGWVFFSYLCLAILVRFQDAWHSNRFILVPVLIWSLGVGQGLVFIWQWQRQRWNAGLKRWIATITISLIFLSPALKSVTYEAGRDKNILRAGEWLARHSTAATTVLTNDDRITFYAHRNHVRLDIDCNNLEELILRHKAAYVIVSGTHRELSRFSDAAALTEVQSFPGKNKSISVFETGLFKQPAQSAYVPTK
jgi:hypothetical protein